jgi:hypothetical protein
MRQLVADFEATTDPNDCRVWAYGICDINTPEYFHFGNNIEEFFNYAKDSKNADFYFHNLEYDGEFILYYLLTHGYRFVEDKKYLEDKTFTTIISDMGRIYTIRIMFEKKNRHVNAINIYDSHKIIPLSVKRIAIDFGLPILKGEIDYDAHNGKHEPPTPEEIAYLHNDVEIVARALQWFVTQDFNKMTIGSNALKDYKNVITSQKFKQWFPSPDFETDQLLRHAYKGGYTWLEPRYKGKDILAPIIVLDVNSLYPSRMHDCKLPFDEGIRFEGQYETDEVYCLCIQVITCQFKLKPDHIATIQIKHSIFADTEYLTSSGDERPTLSLTNVDLELFFNQYDVYNIEYKGGWKFRGSTQLFDVFVDKWMEIKEKATVDHNKALRAISKLFMNNIYGKLSTNPLVQSKIPYLEDGIVKYKLGEEEVRQALHIACGAFITAYARYKTITSAQTIRTAFAEGKSDIDIIYCDTDSLHCISPRRLLPEGLDIHPTRLGAWKHEGTFERGKFLRQKTYMECEELNQKDYNDMPECDKRKYVYYWNGKRIINHITCAGMPESCHEYVTWDNFKTGARYHGKLQTTHVVGGIVLKPIDFTIKK